DVGLSGAEGRRGVLQLVLGGVVAGHHAEIEAALHELQEPTGFGFDEILFAGGQELQRQRLLILHRLAQQIAHLDALQPGGEGGEGFGGEAVLRGEGAGGADELQAFFLGGQRNGNGGHARVLDDPLVQFRQILRDQTDGEVGAQKGGVLGPAFQGDERVPVVGGKAGDVAGGSDGLGEIHNESDLASVGDAQTEVVVQQVEYAVGVARQGGRV